MAADIPDPHDGVAVLSHIQARASSGEFRVTQHAQQEMAEEDILLDDVLEAIGTSQLLENYAAHRRGPCCLLHGISAAGRHLHIVCTTIQPRLIIITVYEPKPPKWPTPTERRREP